jgi:fructose-1-phosphate kinase PfkB-like protein
MDAPAPTSHHHLEPDGTVTKLNEPGSALSRAITQCCLGSASLDLSRRRTGVVFSGAFRCSRSTAHRVDDLGDRSPGLAVGTSGDALTRFHLSQPVPGDQSPIAQSSRRRWGGSSDSISDVIVAARLRALGVERVLVRSPFGADGAVVSEHGRCR